MGRPGGAGRLGRRLTGDVRPEGDEMARIGVMTTEFDAASLEEAAEQIARHGIGCIQLQLGSAIREIPTTDALLRGLDVLGDKINTDLAAYCREVFDGVGIEIAAVDGTYNMVHPDRNRRARNLDHLLRLIDLAPRFGTRIVTVCTGSRDDMMWRRHPANGSEEAWQDLVEQLRTAAAAAEATGVVLAFEPEHNNVIDSAGRARRLMDEVGSPALKVLMDAANIFHAGDLQRMRDHLHEAFELVGGDIVLAHAKDLDHDGDAGGRAAGTGLLDYAGYLAELQAHGFDGAIVLHQLAELMPDRVDEAFRHVRDRAPAGYLD
ncbi:sugar phosphate isomerase/epimerase family protein [Microlunatus ginsengisoli]|uniref:sugar phosphate isomerase/epimerase family protein n=1 Tax=Microlunatus ginsengisoli TaxID=363863 RepID=UPI0031D3E4FE